jgi:hypothetical protein
MFRHAVLLVSLLAAAGCLAQKGKSMTTERDDVAALLQQAGPAALQGDPKALGQLELRASYLDFRGLAVLGPSRTGAAGALPLVVLVQKSVLRGWEVGEEANLALLAFDPEHGGLQIGRALVDRKAQEHPAPALERPPRPPASAAQTLMTKAYRFDVREHLELPPGPRTWVLRALAYDWISNGARIELEGGPAGPATPATVQPTPATSAGQLPIYEPSNRYPPAPADGAAFRIETLKDGRTLILAGFSKQLSAADVLPVPQQLATASGPRKVVAIVHVGFALIAQDHRARPGIATWSVPVFGQATAQQGQRVTGQFAIDLQALAGVRTDSPRVAYLFIGEHVAGPQPVPAAAPR